MPASRARRNRSLGGRRWYRRGGILLEILVSLSIFVGAGAVVLGSVMNVNRSLAASRDRQIAIDIARSKMAELEAGLTTVERLNSNEFVDRRVEPLDPESAGEGMGDPFVGGGGFDDTSDFGFDRNEQMRSAVRTFDGDDATDLDMLAGGDPAATRWRIEASSERSRFANLSIVTVRVFDTQRGEDPEQGVEVYVLRQLVRLSPEDEDAEFEQDDVFDNPGLRGGGFREFGEPRGGGG